MNKLKSLRALQKIRREEKEENLPKVKRRRLPRRIFCFVALIIFTLAVGGTGGIILDRFGLPYLLVQFPELNKYEFLKSANERTIIIEKTIETKISSDRAEIEAIKKITPSLVTAAFFYKEAENDKDINFSGGGVNNKTGFIFTSDGLIIAKMDRPPGKNELVKIKFQDGKILAARWIGFDKSNGSAILKVEDNNLPMITFNGSSPLELGEKLIAVSDEAVVDASISQIVSDHSPAAQKRIIITRELPQNFCGVPLINIKGEIVGISEKENLIIPIDEVRNFVDEVLKK